MGRRAGPAHLRRHQRPGVPQGDESLAAAAGGITTIICQPDTKPVIDNSATVDFILRRARDTAIVNIHPMAALTKDMMGGEMSAGESAGAAGEGTSITNQAASPDATGVPLSADDYLLKRQ